MDLTARRLVGITKELLEGEQLDDILRRLLDTGRELTGARYAAIGVVNERGVGLSRFLVDGIETEVAAGIGDLPRGHGVLGELIRHPQPLRLNDVSKHPRSYGFPVGHPPMKTFLGAPIVVRGRAYGNLYLTEKADGEEFSEVDEENVVMLAECAAVAIDHAQRFDALEVRRDELERSVAALSATNEINRALAGETDLAAVLELVAKRARALVLARSLLILLPERDGLRIAQVVGEAPADFQRDGVVGPDSVADHVLRSGTPQRLDSDPARERFEAAGLGRLELPAKAGLFVPMRFRGRSVGVLAALDRIEAGPDFTHDDEELLVTFAVTAASAVSTAQTISAERMRERDAAAEAERRRWARELHDETLQGLAAIRVGLAAARDQSDAAMRETVESIITDVQAEVDRLRAIIQDVRPSSLDDLGLVAALESLVARHGGEQVAISLRADLDRDADGASERLDPEVETALFRIAQEALTNALKHGQASAIEIAVAQMGDDVGIRVRDNGVGFDPSGLTVGVGLVGMRERVDMLAGKLSVVSDPGGGTTVEARLPSPQPQDEKTPGRVAG